METISINRRFNTAYTTGVLLLVVVLSGACGQKNVRIPPTERVPVEDLGTTVKDPVPEMRIAEGRNSAVRALHRDAELRAKQGKYASASALLERALLIDPYDPVLWNNLADARFKENKLPLAENLALKSNSYAKGDTQLKINNWELIAKARGLRGDADGASKATQQAEVLKQR